jgi:hypothetical protein
MMAGLFLIIIGVALCSLSVLYILSVAVSAVLRTIDAEKIDPKV